MMHYYIIIFLLSLFNVSLLVSMERDIGPLAVLLVPTDKRIYNSVSNNIQQKKIVYTKNSNHIDPIQCLPNDILFMIKKYLHFSVWRDELAQLADISPIKIGNKELWPIDLWRMSSCHKNIVLSYHNKTEFTADECEQLQIMMPVHIIQGLKVDRWPSDEELYPRCAAIPGAARLWRFGVGPAVGLGMLAVLGILSTVDNNHEDMPIIKTMGYLVPPIATVFTALYAQAIHYSNFENRLTAHVFLNGEMV